MDCLAEGRSVSLPASAVGGAKLAVNAVGAYARIRKQVFHCSRCLSAYMYSRTLCVDLCGHDLYANFCNLNSFEFLSLRWGGCKKRWHALLRRLTF